MACGCTKRTRAKFVWTDASGGNPVTYNTEIEAKAKVIREAKKNGGQGGSYVTQSPSAPSAKQRR